MLLTGVVRTLMRGDVDGEAGGDRIEMSKAALAAYETEGMLSGAHIQSRRSLLGA